MRNWYWKISIFFGVFVACGLQASLLFGAPLAETIAREVEQSIERKFERRAAPPLERPSGYIQAHPGEDIKLRDDSGNVQTEDQARRLRDYQRSMHKCAEGYLERSDKCEQE